MIFSNREKQMTKFLKNVIQYTQKNGNITYEEVYSLLINYGLPKKDIGVKINDLFEKWINRYEKNNNINVYTSSNDYFCNFRNDKNSDSFKKYECIKLIIPLKGEYLLEGVNRIFDFLSTENIKHVSNVASEIRNDNVVIRVYNELDAKKIQQFVKNDDLIKQAVNKPNPFLVTDGLIAYTCNSTLSYDGQLSRYICEYVNILKTTGSLEYISLESFKSYISRRAKSYTTEEGFNLLLEKYKSPYKILGVYNISNVIDLSLSINTKVTDIIKVFTTLSNEKYRKNQINSIRSLIDAKFQNNLNYSVTLQNVLEIACYETYKKYGKNQLITALKKAIFDMNFGCFTNNNNARINLKENINNQIILQIILQTLNYNDNSNIEQIILEYSDYIERKHSYKR